jgi:hypothetical protein
MIWFRFEAAASGMGFIIIEGISKLLSKFQIYTIYLHLIEIDRIRMLMSIRRVKSNST